MDAYEFVDRVIVGLNRYLQDNPDVRLADVAVDLGYRVDTLQKFRAGTCRSVRLALQVAEIMPETVEVPRCPCCRAIPSLRFTNSRTG